MVSSGSSISPSFPIFPPQNPSNFAPNIIKFRPQTSLEVPMQIWKLRAGHPGHWPDIRLLEGKIAQVSGHQAPEIRAPPRMSDPWDFSHPCFTVLSITNSSELRFRPCFEALDIPHNTKIPPSSFDSIIFCGFWHLCLGPPPHHPHNHHRLPQPNHFCPP